VARVEADSAKGRANAAKKSKGVSRAV
jgi:hypothetical protein